MENIAVFYGGTAVEHDVSVITGVLTLNSLDKKRFNPVPIYIDYDGAFYTGEQLFDIENYKNLDYKKLKRVTLFSGSEYLYYLKKNKLLSLIKINASINCVHGERGEDGSIDGLLSLCNIPSASPPIVPSAVSMDKSVTKAVLKGINVKCLPFVTLKRTDDIIHAVDKIKKKFSYPLIVKPVKLGSSIGIKKATNDSELESAVFDAFRYGDKAIIEKCLEDFIEINCAIYRDKSGKIIVSECERPLGVSEVLSFDDKYTCGNREFPANIEEDISNKIKKISEKVYSELDFKGIIRIDYFIKDGEIFLNEINSVPGSLAYYLFCDTLKKFGEVLNDLITVAKIEFSAQTTLKRKFSSSILNLSGSKSSKRL